MKWAHQHTASLPVSIADVLIKFSLTLPFSRASHHSIGCEDSPQSLASANLLPLVRRHSQQRKPRPRRLRPCVFHGSTQRYLSRPYFSNDNLDGGGPSDYIRSDVLQDFLLQVYEHHFPRLGSILYLPAGLRVWSICPVEYCA